MRDSFLKSIIKKIGFYRRYNEVTFLVECYFRKYKFFEYFSLKFLKKFSDHIIEHVSIKTSNQIYALEHIMSQVHHESFSKYRDAFVGRDVVILGAGPTLKSFKRDDFSDAIFIGVNKTIVQFPNMHYYFLSDWTAAVEYGITEEIQKSSAKKFFHMGIWNDEYYNGWDMPPLDFARKCDASFYFAINYTGHQAIQKDIAQHPLYGYGTVVISPFHFALFCHPRRVFIVGCDCSDGGHYDDISSIVYPSHHIALIREEWRRMALFAKYHYPDVEIISINPVGLKGLFKDEYR